MLFQLDIKTRQKEMQVHWCRDENGGYLRFQRKNGGTVLKLYADYADERSLKVCARSLTFMFNGPPQSSTQTTKSEVPDGD